MKNKIIVSLFFGVGTIFLIIAILLCNDRKYKAYKELIVDSQGYIDELNELKDGSVYSSVSTNASVGFGEKLIEKYESQVKIHQKKIIVCFIASGVMILLGVVYLLHIWKNNREKT